MEAVFSDVVVASATVARSTPLPPALPSGPTWLVSIVRPLGPPARVSLRLETADGAIAAVEERTIDGPDALLLAYAADAPAPLHAVLDAHDAAVEVTAWAVGAEEEHAVDVPLHLLGGGVVESLDSVNATLRRMIAGVFAADVKKKKKKLIYICGFNHVNKGTTCTIVNFIICGAKKDKDIISPDSGPDNTTNLAPFLDLIRDGGRLLAEAPDRRVDEFNGLARIARAVDAQTELESQRS